MSVSVIMPHLGESVTEGTVTRWLKKEGEHVAADEPLLEVSTDKVDTEIPSPASGVLRGIAVAEDETVAVGVELAVIEDADVASGPAARGPRRACRRGTRAAGASRARLCPAPRRAARGSCSRARPRRALPRRGCRGQRRHVRAEQLVVERTAAPGRPGRPRRSPAPGYAPPPAPAPAGYAPPEPPAPAYAPPVPVEDEPADSYPEPTPLPTGESPYVTPLVRKLAAEHAAPLEAITGTGVGRPHPQAGRPRGCPRPVRRRGGAAAQAAAAAPAAARCPPRPGAGRRAPASRPCPPGRSFRPRCAAPRSGCPGRAPSSPSG